MNDTNCPYCNAEVEIDHDDGYGYEEDRKHMQCCDSCGKEFVYTTSIIYLYDTYKADCLNDGKHEYTPTHVSPKEYTKMECIMCGDRRKPTPEEMIEILKPKP